jgi:hypothetical protein
MRFKWFNPENQDYYQRGGDPPENGKPAPKEHENE